MEREPSEVDFWRRSGWMGGRKEQKKGRAQQMIFFRTRSGFLLSCLRPTSISIFPLFFHALLPYTIVDLVISSNMKKKGPGQRTSELFLSSSAPSFHSRDSSLLTRQSSFHNLLRLIRELCDFQSVSLQAPFAAAIAK